MSVLQVIKELFKNAEHYARNGFPVHEVLAKNWNANKKKLRNYNQ